VVAAELISDRGKRPDLEAFLRLHPAGEDSGTVGAAAEAGFAVKRRSLELSYARACRATAIRFDPPRLAASNVLHVARVGLIDRSIQEATSRLDLTRALVTLDS
jgi:hypothetical protein